jgi:hypothetical protein
VSLVIWLCAKLTVFLWSQLSHSPLIIFLVFPMQALDTFNTAVVSPIYYVMFTSLTILASVIMFKVCFSTDSESILCYFFNLI